MAGPVFGPAPCPPYQIPVFNQDGTLNMAWYRFWSGINTTSGGINIVTLATMPPLSNKVGSGFYYLTDYLHLLFWNGVTLSFADGGNNYYSFADANPATGSQIAEAGWHPMDGTAAVDYLVLVNGATPGVTTASRALQNLIGTAAYLKAGVGASSLNAPIAPTFAGTPLTPAGTNSAPALTMNAFTPAGNISAPLFAGTAATITTDLFINTAGTNAAMISLDSSATSYTPRGTVSAPGFTGTPATPTGTVAAPVFSGTPVTPAGTVSTTGQPENFYSRLWFRV